MTLQVWERAEAVAGSPATADGEPPAPGARRLRPPSRRRAFWLAAVLVGLVLVATASWLAYTRAAHRGVALDPDNVGPEGARAVARVLDDHGVDVTVARGEDALLDTRPGGTTTLVVTGTGALSDTTAATMLDHASAVRRIVLVQPDSLVLSALDLPVETGGRPASTAPLRASCTLDGLAADDTIAPSGRDYASSTPGAIECFGRAGGSALVAVPAGADRPEVVVLGDPLLLRNDSVTRLDHAGVALRLLGRGDSVVWYVPSTLDIATGDETATSEIPPAFWPLVFLLLWALVASMLWRGRRFGPLVTEPLPAVVKAIETTQSRGRLYRRAGDTGRAAQALRARTTRRLAHRLGLPARAAPTAVADAVSAATGMDPARAHHLLAGPLPTTESALVSLTHDLSQLEKEVRRA